jgi:PAS domain S-box-containing protein
VRSPDGVNRAARDARAAELARLVDNVIDYAIFLLDPQGYILTWNRGAEQTKGYTGDEIIGKHFSSFYTEEDLARNHPANELEIAVREGRYEEEGWRIRKDGSRFWANVVITCIRDERGDVAGFGKVTRDLTARRLAEEHLRATSQRLQKANDELEQFRRLVLGVEDYAIFMLDPGGHIVTWNAGAQRLKGYSGEEAIGRHFSIFYTQEDRDRDHPAHELEVAARSGRYEEEGWRVRKDGTTFWANVLITALRNETGVLIGYSKVTRDLTERRLAEEALQDANALLARTNAELDRFAGVAAHDLREPLRTIGGFSELLQQRYAEVLDERGETYLHHIQRAVGRMQALVDDLLDFARGNEDIGRQEPVVLAPTVEDVLGELRATIDDRGVVVRVEVQRELAVLASQADVLSILRNLLSNAVKFADDEQPQVVVRATVDDGAARVEVVDNGIGIDPAERPRIFRAFHRLNSAAEYPGTGLGLAIAQRIVERNEGAIGVDSMVGQGSTFWFTLPVAS